jgi:hypothetical protein
MAQFCTKCGSPMGEGMQFCTTCGAVTGGSPAAAPQVPAVQPVTPSTPLATPPTPMPTGTLAPPVAPKSGSPIMKIVLIVVAVIIFFMVIVGASCAYMLYRAKQKVSQFEKQVQTSFPSRTGTRGGQPTENPETPGENPTPGAGPAVNISELSYPGATLGQGANQSIFGAAGIKMQEYLTSDSIDTVVAYYKNKLGNNAAVTESGGNAVLQVGGTGGLTTIHIATDSASGKTKITVSSIGKQ